MTSFWTGEVVECMLLRIKDKPFRDFLNNEMAEVGVCMSKDKPNLKVKAIVCLS